MRFNLPMPRAPVADGPGVAGAPGAGARPAVRVVTDSTACLPQAHALLGLRDIAVVPLQVLTPHGDRREGIDITAAEVAQRIEAGQRLTTSQPAAEDFAAAYRALAADGAEAIVSVHLSGELSGTVQAAERAAQRSMVPVRVIDSRTTTMALGFAALAAAQCAAAGADGEHVAARACEIGRASCRERVFQPV
jgi:DegV family protein with EDD domain